MILESKRGTCLSKLSLVLILFVALQLGSASAAEAAVHDQTAVIHAIRAEFADVPAMVAVAKCESKFRQYTDSGNVFYGGYGGQMVGVFQFYEIIHKGTAHSLGYKLSTLEGNIAYARYLYEMEGLTPWNSSRSCWEPQIGTILAETAAVARVDTGSDTQMEKPTREELEARLAQLRKIVALLTTLLELKGLS